MSTLVDYDLAQFLEVAVVHGLGEALVESVALGFDFSHTRACGQELLAVESLAEALGGFCALFIDFFVLLPTVPCPFICVPKPPRAFL